MRHLQDASSAGAQRVSARQRRGAARTRAGDAPDGVDGHQTDHRQRQVVTAYVPTASKRFHGRHGARRRPAAPRAAGGSACADSLLQPGGRGRGRPGACARLPRRRHAGCARGADGLGAQACFARGCPTVSYNVEAPRASVPGGPHAARVRRTDPTVCVARVSRTDPTVCVLHAAPRAASPTPRSRRSQALNQS